MFEYASVRTVSKSSGVPGVWVQTVDCRAEITVVADSPNMVQEYEGDKNNVTSAFARYISWSGSVDQLVSTKHFRSPDVA
jgi:hypothetical protein